MQKKQKQKDMIRQARKAILIPGSTNVCFMRQWRTQKIYVALPVVTLFLGYERSDRRKWDVSNVVYTWWHVTINANTAKVPPIPCAAIVCRKMSGWSCVVFPVVTFEVVTIPAVSVVGTGATVDDKVVLLLVWRRKKTYLFIYHKINKNLYFI